MPYDGACSWDRLKLGGFNVNLHVATDPWLLVEDVLVITFAGAIVALNAAGVALIAAKPKDVVCSAGPGGDNTQIGVEWQCRREFN
jgi:hypothetical protein